MQIVLPHPGVAGLYLSAEAVPIPGGSISATGVAATPQMARCLSEAEMAERKAVAQLRAKGLLPAGCIYGAAASPARSFARTRALQELCERVAARRWWCTGGPARRAPARAWRSATAVLARHRRRHRRRTGFMDIGVVPGAPVILAWSAEADGRGLCFGLACRATAAAAAGAAMIELFQMEFALTLARARKARGVTLPAAEARLLDRAARLSLAWLRRRQPAAPRPAETPAARPAVLAGRLHGAGLYHRFHQMAVPATGHRIAIARLLPVAHARPRAAPPRWSLY